MGSACICASARPHYQDAEKVRQQRTRIVQAPKVPQRVCLGPSLAAALLIGLLSILGECSPVVPHTSHEGPLLESWNRSPCTDASLLLCLTRQPAEESWETFGVRTVLHGGVDVVK